MSECCHKLCRAPATEAVDVYSRHCIFIAPRDTETRHYELCDAHFRRYFPQGVGFMRRSEAVALRIHCRAMAESVSPTEGTDS